MLITLTAWLATSAAAQDICAICGQPINGSIYLITDEVTGQKLEVCSNCIKLPRCFICGLPVKDNGMELSDGRHLCARDGKTAVLNAGDAQQVAAEVHDELDRLFARFTSFPTNVDVTVLDRIDVDTMFQPGGNDFESPDLLGCIEPKTVGSQKRYFMRLLTGLPLVELKATAAHELSHAWVGENVPVERHARLARDAEEGFCEMVAYLLMDSQNEAGQKKFILKNYYTRGQVQLFIAAEEHYGFDAILDWMKFGTADRLEEGQMDKIRDISPPPAASAASPPAFISKIDVPNNIASDEMNPHSPTLSTPAAPPSFKLEGILWGRPPLAIINGRTFGLNDQGQIPFGQSNLVIRCLAIQPESVRIRKVDSGQEQELALPAN